MTCFAFQTSITGIPAMIEFGSSIAELLTCNVTSWSEQYRAQGRESGAVDFSP